MDFKTRLRELRLEKGLSQKQLGELIGATYSAISFWETGVNEPKISYVIALCKFFEVSADYLLGLTE